MAETLTSLQSKVSDLLGKAESLLPLLQGSEKSRVSKLKADLSELKDELSYLDDLDDLSELVAEFQAIREAIEPVLKHHSRVRRIEVGGTPPASPSSPGLSLKRGEAGWVLNAASPSVVASAQEVAALVGSRVLETNDLDIWRGSQMPRALTGSESRFWRGLRVRLSDED